MFEPWPRLFRCYLCTMSRVSASPAWYLVTCPLLWLRSGWVNQWQIPDRGPSTRT